MESRNSSFGSFWMGHGDTSVPVSCDSDYSGIPFFALECLMETVKPLKDSWTCSLNFQYMQIGSLSFSFVPDDSFIRIWSRYSP